MHGNMENSTSITRTPMKSSEALKNQEKELGKKAFHNIYSLFCS